MRKMAQVIRMTKTLMQSPNGDTPIPLLMTDHLKPTRSRSLGLALTAGQSVILFIDAIMEVELPLEWK